CRAARPLHHLPQLDISSNNRRGLARACRVCYGQVCLHRERGRCYGRAGWAGTIRPDLLGSRHVRAAPHSSSGERSIHAGGGPSRVMTSAVEPFATEPSDAELIRRTRDGDADAYGALFARHADAARMLAARLTSGTPVAADDVVSD